MRAACLLVDVEYWGLRARAGPSIEMLYAYTTTNYSKANKGYGNSTAIQACSAKLSYGNPLLLHSVLP